ncbi:hypothetical protein [Streptomyces sp. NPDC092370]|uniref:hypothetical protein n=1 Tax=Streptomyces sp. NPDC092370 TaxID=3366016 RepID=UPI0038203DDE
MFGEDGPASRAFRVVVVAAHESDRPLTGAVDGMRELRDDEQDLGRLGPHRHRRIGGRPQQERQRRRHGRAQCADTVHPDVAGHPLGLASRGRVQQTSQEGRDPGGAPGEVRPGDVVTAAQRGVIPARPMPFRELLKEPCEGGFLARRGDPAHPLCRP